MANFRFNQPLKLINKKPKGEQMVDNDYGFYMYPSLVIAYASKTLSKRELCLYLAISGQAEKDKMGKPCHWAIKHYCQIANIKANHYAEVLESLCKKGFIKHNNFESIEVIYPISDNEVISSNGKIVQIENVQDSQNGNSACYNEQDSISQNKEEESFKNGNNKFNFGNNFSLNKANNKEINNFNNNIYKDKEINSSHKWELYEETAVNWQAYL